MKKILYSDMRDIMEQYILQNGETGLSHVMTALSSIVSDKPICQHYLLRRDDLKAELENTYNKKS